MNKQRMLPLNAGSGREGGHVEESPGCPPLLASLMLEDAKRSRSAYCGGRLWMVKIVQNLTVCMQIVVGHATVENFLRMQHSVSAMIHSF